MGAPRPVGRRVSVETLTGKKLAINASIWMIQFMKAMRDDKGEMVRNAHLLGFFRRICKLLFLRTKPVFVFDGATPALKRRTIAERCRQCDRARINIPKTVEKLLLNHLKAKKLEELAEEVKTQRHKDDDSKGKKVMCDSELAGAQTSASNQESFHEMLYLLLRRELSLPTSGLAASLAAQEGTLPVDKQATAGNSVYKEEDDDDGDEEMMWQERKNPR